MISVRHRSASGRIDEAWEHDPARGCLDVVLHQGSAEPIAFTVPICAIDRPRMGAYSITRLDAESWRVLPAKWVTYPLGHYVDEAIHESLGPGTQLILTNAPADIDAELTAL